MNEMLLQFIWQYSLYNPTGLTTTNGEAVLVKHPGRRNTNSGPDFSEARIRIGNTTLVGNVEIHVKSSDWYRHKHESDAAYQNIILHVVIDDDLPARGYFPTLELGAHIPEYVIHKYTTLIQTMLPIPCGNQLHLVRDITRESWMNRLLAERWEQKLTAW
ncbi:MAG: DUF2851 family protein, partial [Sphingobacteriales bacterium]